MTDLKCCPFCGGEAKYISFTQGLFIQRFVTCTKCGIETKRNYLNKADAVKQWNTRKPMDNIVEKLEELKKDKDCLAYCYQFYSKTCDIYEKAINIVKQVINNGLE